MCNCNTSRETILVADIKALSKAKNASINDVILSCVSKVMHDTLNNLEASKPFNERKPIPSKVTLFPPFSIRFDNEFKKARENV